jgi:PPM family protein phosphatase
MDDPRDSGALLASNTDPLMGSLEELSEPLEQTEVEAKLLPSGTTLAPEDEEPIRIVRLLRDSFPLRLLRLYEAKQDEDEEALWLWESEGESSSLLTNEGALLREVRCPMLPRVQASFSLGGRCYLATESCSGETLAELLSRGKLDPPRAVSILSQVAFALTKLHEAGFVHLGLRPAVVIPGRPTKIVDFSDVTRVGQTPARRFYYAGYSAPELLREEPADVRSDIYALGALLFQVVGGTPIAESGVELMAWDPETPVAGVPQILSRCLGDKDTRYSSAAELHRDLVRLVKRLTPPVRYVLGAATSIGLEPSRTTNQDAFTYCLGTCACEEETQNWLMACVADGMGGMDAGEAASGGAVKSVEAKAQAAFSARSLLLPEVQVTEVKKWAHEANEGVMSALEKRKAKGGSTMVCACLIGNRLAISHVGDCRLYLIRAGEAQLLTRDHSLAMALAMQGEIKLDEVRKHPERSRVTRSLGERRPMPDYLVDTLEQVTGKPTMELEAGDTLLLCSDGVWEPLSDEELLSYVASHEWDLNAAAEAIVRATLARGGGDNATAVLVRLA